MTHCREWRTKGGPPHTPTAAQGGRTGNGNATDPCSTQSVSVGMHSARQRLVHRRGRQGGDCHHAESLNAYPRLPTSTQRMAAAAFPSRWPSLPPLPHTRQSAAARCCTHASYLHCRLQRPCKHGHVTIPPGAHRSLSPDPTARSTRNPHHAHATSPVPTFPVQSLCCSAVTSDAQPSAPLPSLPHMHDWLPVLSSCRPAVAHITPPHPAAHPVPPSTPSPHPNSSSLVLPWTTQLAPSRDAPCQERGSKGPPKRRPCHAPHKSPLYISSPRICHPNAPQPTPNHDATTPQPPRTAPQPPLSGPIDRPAMAPQSFPNHPPQCCGAHPACRWSHRITLTASPYHPITPKGIPKPPPKPPLQCCMPRAPTP